MGIKKEPSAYDVIAGTRGREYGGKPSPSFPALNRLALACFSSSMAELQVYQRPHRFVATRDKATPWALISPFVPKPQDCGTVRSLEMCALQVAEDQSFPNY